MRLDPSHDAGGAEMHNPEQVSFTKIAIDGFVDITLIADSRAVVAKSHLGLAAVGQFNDAIIVAGKLNPLDAGIGKTSVMNAPRLGIHILSGRGQRRFRCRHRAGENYQNQSEPFHLHNLTCLYNVEHYDQGKDR